LSRTKTQRFARVITAVSILPGGVALQLLRPPMEQSSITTAED
jgi:hypothetical protein